MTVKLFEYKDLVKSLGVDIKRGRKISFLIGSAMSYENGYGCPNVNSMLSIIKEYLEETGMLDEEGKAIFEKPVTEAYQTIYEYLFKSGGDQQDIRKLMERYMDAAKNKETGEWDLTSGTNELARYISMNGAKVNNILTTNFDPFIKVSLENNGLKTVSHSLEYNSNVETVLNIDESHINILHLHGHYMKDTMHTKTQLESVRPKVKESIKKILSECSSLYVIGYGGWEDIFIESLKEIVEEFNATYNIRWAFFTDRENDIILDNKNLLKILEPAIAKGRFHAYKGINCHKLFKDVNENLLSVGKLNKDISFEKKENNVHVQPLSLKEVFNPNGKRLEDKLTIHPFELAKEKTHEFIRLYEQVTAVEYLEKSGGFVLESGWGYGKLGFLSSIIFNDESDKIIVRADFENVKTKKDAEDKIIEDIGMDISTLMAVSFEKDFYILIDNIDDPDASLLTYLNEISSIISDSISVSNLENRFYVILVTNKTLNVAFQTITLKELNVDDIKEYVSSVKGSTKPHGTEIDKLYMLTSGMPAKLDKIQEYQESGVMTLADILEEETVEVSPERLSENVPVHLLEEVDLLQKSDNLYNKKLFRLLCVFSMLECGETAKNIKRHFHAETFKLDDFTKLINMNLIKSIKKEEYGTIIILRINPLIKDYIRSKLSDELTLSIVHNAMGLIYGPQWESILIRISSSVKTMLLYQDFFPGNAHTLTIQYVKHCFKHNTENKSKLLKVSVAYCMYLSNKDKFKELVSFSEAVYNLVKHSDAEDVLDILYYYAEGSRMIDNDALTIDLLKNIVEEDREKVKASNHLYNKFLTTYMLALSSTQHEQLLTIATKLMETAPSHSGAFYQAKTEIIINQKNKSTIISNLKKLERSARRDGCLLAANNICLQLVSHTTDDNEKYLKLVLDTENSTYTRIRALITYSRKLLISNPDRIISGGVLSSIVDAYRYLFLQRISLFNKCHDLLWDVFKIFAKFPDLYQVYRTSSILWRLNGDSSKEYKYAQDLISFANSGGDIEVQYVNYVSKRFQYLDTNKEILKIQKL